MGGSPSIARYVGLKPHVDKLIEVLAKKETSGEISAMIRKLVEEALKHRGEIA